MKLRGGGSTYTVYMQNGRGWADRRLVHGGRGLGRGDLGPPLENEKKRLSEEILTSFIYVLLMKLGGGGRHKLHTCKMEGGARTGACPWWEGWGARGPCPPPLEKEKRKGEYRPINAVGDK